jgi:hypothetical protein
MEIITEILPRITGIQYNLKTVEKQKAILV